MKNVSSKSKFLQSRKSTKNTVPNTVSIDLSWILPKIEILIHTLDITELSHIFNTRTASSPDQEKLLKKSRQWLVAKRMTKSLKLIFLYKTHFYMKESTRNHLM